MLWGMAVLVAVYDNLYIFAATLLGPAGECRAIGLRWRLKPVSLLPIPLPASVTPDIGCQSALCYTVQESAEEGEANCGMCQCLKANKLKYGRGRMRAIVC